MCLDSREIMWLPRLYWIFGNKDLEDIGGSLPLYSRPAVWFWGSRINAFLSEYNIFDIWFTGHSTQCFESTRLNLNFNFQVQENCQSYKDILWRVSSVKFKMLTLNSQSFQGFLPKEIGPNFSPCVCIKFPGDPSGRKAKETPFTQRPLCARKSWSKTMQTRWKGIKAVKALEVFQKFYLEHLQTFRILQMLCFKENLKLKTSFFERKMVVRVKI